MFTLPGLWPTHEQRLALKAALSTEDAAVAAFHDWLSVIDLNEDFDQGTLRLLPLMYDNLQAHRVAHPVMRRLKGVYRLTWYRNNKLFGDVRPVLDALKTANIPIMLIKGAPLAERYYRNIAVRPMSDIDIVVPTRMAENALRVMASFPYTPYTHPTDDYLKYRHAMRYASQKMGEIDMHWHALCDCRAANDDDIFWKAAVPFVFGGVPCVTPDATRLLFQTTIHGVRWNEETPIRWIADAMAILRSAEEIDWAAIEDHAFRSQLGHRLHLALAYLKHHFGAPIPVSVLARIAAQRTTLVQRIENTVVLRNATHLYGSPLGHLWISFCDYCRFARNEPPLAFAIGFTHYMRFRWELRGRREMIGYVLRGIMKRIKRWFRPALPQPAEDRAAD